jgi:hypothetical protein
MQDFFMQLKGSSNPMICNELKKVETQWIVIEAFRSLE